MMAKCQDQRLGDVPVKQFPTDSVQIVILMYVCVNAG